jgi:hypothetical protein
VVRETASELILSAEQTELARLDRVVGKLCQPDAQNCTEYGKNRKLLSSFRHGSRRLAIVRTTEIDPERDTGSALCLHTLSVDELFFLPQQKSPAPSKNQCADQEASQLTAQALADLEEDADGAARARLELAVARDSKCWETHRQLARVLGMEHDPEIAKHVLAAHRLRPSETLTWLRSDDKTAGEFRRAAPAEATRLLGQK